MGVLNPIPIVLFIIGQGVLVQVFTLENPTVEADYPGCDGLGDLFTSCLGWFTLFEIYVLGEIPGLPDFVNFVLVFIRIALVGFLAWSAFQVITRLAGIVRGSGGGV